MKRFAILLIGFIAVTVHINGKNYPYVGLLTDKTEFSDSLPLVLSGNNKDLINSKLRHEASLRYAEHRLPDNITDWNKYREHLKSEIIKKTGIHIDHDLPLNMRDLGSISMKGYIIKNIAFQTLPGVYATANLFIPDGKGPFPAVINLHAHSGRFDDNDQAVGHSLAVHGYVCLSIDPWGAGERTTIHGITEYHGANLGASFLNIGESLMGIQISDNMRGVDLLCSLPFVDAQNIGATGASGGGNQTMWLSAVDDRIKAAVPVVSVGTFESYVMGDNCICEMLTDGLTFTEEAGVLALSRAIMPCNHNYDESPTFYSSEMMRSYYNAKPVFEMMGKGDNISYRTFDLPHGFLTEDREAMIGWFNLHLKNSGNGEAVKELPFTLLTEKELMVYPRGRRAEDVISTVEYCKMKGAGLRKTYLNTKYFDVDQKKKDLNSVLRINEKPEIKQIIQYSSKNGWDRFVLETKDSRLIPLLHLPPSDKSLGYVIICNPEGKNNISTEIINEYKRKGTGIVAVDLTGTGEVASPSDRSSDPRFIFHTLARAELWLGKTILGEWVKDLSLVTDYLNTAYKPSHISVDGYKEAGLAGLFFGSLENNGVERIILRDAPVSYLFDNRDSVDFYSMSIHLPGFLNWGDVSMAAAQSGKNVTFINPRTMSGAELPENRLSEFQNEFDLIRSLCRQPGKAEIQKK